MRISDWSSDVCSSDLVLSCALRVARRLPARRERAHHVCPRALGVDGPLHLRGHRRGQRRCLYLAPSAGGFGGPRLLADRCRLRFPYAENGRAHARTPVTNAPPVCRLLLAKITKATTNIL